MDAQIAPLAHQRAALVAEYERHRFAILGRTPPPALGPPAPERQEWSGARVRALLLWLGAALLGISAITFTAVAWSRLGDGGRAALLIATTAAVTALALALRRRLPMTAEAFTGLAIVLALVDVYALRRAGLAAAMPWQVWWSVGVAVVAGCAAALGRLVGRRTTVFAVAALLPVAVQLLAAYADAAWSAALILALLAAAIVEARHRWAGRLRREARAVLGLHAAGSWGVAALLAALAAAEAESVVAALGPSLAVAALAGAPLLARRGLTDGGPRTAMTALAAGVPAGVVLTLVGPLLGEDGMLTAGVVAGGVTILVATLWRSLAGLIAGAAFALPGALWAATVATPAVLGPLAWLSRPWSASLNRVAAEVYEGPLSGPPLTGSWAAVGALGAVGAVGVVLGMSRRRLLGIATAAVGVLSALVPVTAGASVLGTLVATTAVVVGVLLAAGLADRARAGEAWALLPGAVIAAAPTIGWAAVSAAASVTTLAITTLAAGAAAVLARGATRATFAGLAGMLGAAFAGVAVRAAGAGLPAAGFTGAVVAGGVALAGVYLMRGQPVARAALEGTAALSAFTGVVIAGAHSTTWLAGTLSALVPVAAVAALSADRRVRYGIAAGVLALCAVWAWLAAGRVGTVEAYTAPAAAAALAAGIIGWRAGPGRSWLTLGPALVLAIGPTLVIGIAEDDAVRVVVAVGLGLIAVVSGAVLRLQAPLCIGAVALLAIGIDQWGADLVRMPRWITLGAAGVVLMWVGATFEARRRDWRRASEVLGRFG